MAREKLMDLSSRTHLLFGMSECKTGTLEVDFSEQPPLGVGLILVYKNIPSQQSDYEIQKLILFLFIYADDWILAFFF